MLERICEISFFRDAAAIIITGFAIKFTDDYLDEDLSTQIEQAFLPYFLLLFSVSALISREGTGFFLAAYSIGMLKDPNLKLPFGLSNWHESVIVIFISIMLLGCVKTVESVAIMLTVQIADDIWDYYALKEKSANNTAARFGIVEAFTALMIFFIISIMLDALKTVFVCLVTPIILVIYNKLIGREIEIDDSV